MANVNRIYQGAVSGQGFTFVELPCNHSASGGAIEQGDLVYLDTTADILKPCTSDANAANFVGIALDPTRVSSNIDNTASLGDPTKLAVATGRVICQLKTTAAEGYQVGDLVYVGADAQTVTRVAATNAVGRVVEAVTGAAGVTVKVMIQGKLY